MDSTESVSKGCFVFKPKEESKKTKKKYTDILDFSDELWYNTYSIVWKNIENKLQKINREISDVVLHDLELFISNCQVLTNPIQTAVLLMGVNLPDHNSLFTSLASRLQTNLTPHIALLQSQDCISVKSTIEQMVSQFLKKAKIIDEDELMDVDIVDSDSDEEVTNYKRSDCTLPHLLEWYKDNQVDEECEENVTSSNINKKLVVILKDFEGFPSSVLEDFILILSQYAQRLPMVLVMGVATTASALHRSMSHSVTSQLNIRIFQSKPSVYFLNNTLDNVFLQADCPFQLGSKVFTFLTDVFLYYDFSVDGFMKGIKYCLMEHFHSSPTSVLCCYTKDLNKIIEVLSDEHLEAFKKLSSFHTYFNKLPKQKQTKIQSNSSAFKDLLKTLILELRDKLATFYLFIRILQVFVADLPNAPLGKQIREIYSEAVSSKLTHNPGYNECFKILEFTAKDELVNKLNKALKLFEKFETKSDNVIIIENKLKEHAMKIENVGFRSITGTPTKSPSKAKFNVTSRAQFKEHLEKMSLTKKPKNEFEAARGEFLSYLKDEVFEQILIPVSLLPLNEVILFDNIKSVKRHIIGSPRAAIHTALNNPYHYLQCDCCKITNEGEIFETMPDICIAYKLHLESGSLINMYDWLQSFATVVDPEHMMKNDSGNISSFIQARFTQAVAELQFLGFIKSSKKKTDHVTRLTWGGSM